MNGAGVGEARSVRDPKIGRVPEQEISCVHGCLVGIHYTPKNTLEPLKLDGSIAGACLLNFGLQCTRNMRINRILVFCAHCRPKFSGHASAMEPSVSNGSNVFFVA